MLASRCRERPRPATRAATPPFRPPPGPAPGHAAAPSRGERPDETADGELTAEEATFMKATGQSKEHIIKSRALSTLGKAH